MLMMMVIFSVMSAGLFYASRVPAVQDDLSVILSSEESAADEEGGRVAHIVFIMFTFTSPLILASVLSTITAALRWYERRA